MSHCGCADLADGGSIAECGIELSTIERCFIKGAGTVFCCHSGDLSGFIGPILSRNSGSRG